MINSILQWRTLILVNFDGLSAKVHALTFPIKFSLCLLSDNGQHYTVKIQPAFLAGCIFVRLVYSYSNGLFVRVGVGVRVGVKDGVGVGTVGVGVYVGVRVGVLVAVGVRLCVGVRVGVFDGVDVLDGVGVRDGVGVLVLVGVRDGV